MLQIHTIKTGYSFYFEEILFKQIENVITFFMVDCKTVKLLSFPRKPWAIKEEIIFFSICSFFCSLSTMSENIINIILKWNRTMACVKCAFDDQDLNKT
jgi:hypothetical protein